MMVITGSGIHMITQSGNDQPAKESEDAEFTSRCTQKRRKRRTSCTSVDSASQSQRYFDIIHRSVGRLCGDSRRSTRLRTAALGVDASTDEAVTKSYEATVRKTQTTLVPSTIVKFLGTPTAIPIRRQAGTLHCACCWKTVPPTQAIWRCAY